MTDSVSGFGAKGNETVGVLMMFLLLQLYMARFSWLDVVNVYSVLLGRGVIYNVDSSKQWPG